jgi:hypothetical protein
LGQNMVAYQNSAIWVAWKQSPQNVGILGSRIPRKVLESEEGSSLKG